MSMDDLIREVNEMIIKEQQKVIERLTRDNEALKTRNQELESAVERMDDLLVQKQYVIDIQRKGIKKLVNRSYGHKVRDNY